MPTEHRELPLSEAAREWARSRGEEADPDWNVQTSRGFGWQYIGIFLADHNFEELSAMIKRWASRSIAIPDHTSWPALLDRIEAGWPMKALFGEQVVHSFQNLRNAENTPPARKQRIQYAFAFLPPEIVPSGDPMFRYLPLRPMWPGFLVNSLLYGAILRLLVGGPLLLRRFIRGRHGQCPACGYPVGVSAVCTECGRAVSPRADSSEPDSSHIPLD